jgi:hypothetical protein
VRSQREKCRVSVKSDAATQRENQSFMQAAAKINGRIHTLWDKPTLVSVSSMAAFRGRALENGKFNSRKFAPKM